MALLLFGKEPDSVFDMNCHDENSATFALGWVLEKSPALLEMLLNDLMGTSSREDKPQIKLQHYAKHEGFTDIEISCPNICHVIIEAKRGWTLPSQEQLKKYALRSADTKTGTSLIVSVSAASGEYAKRCQPASIGRILLKHRSWSDLVGMAVQSSRKSRMLEEKFWLRELQNHLEDYASMQNTHDNRVYVVSLSQLPASNDPNYSFIDVVEKDQRYFHPVGGSDKGHKGWPVEPPNYIGFRYHGRLQSIHHVDKFEVVQDLQSKNKKWPKTEEDHFVYWLGPPMKPRLEVRTGKIFRSGRVWCAIDTLLSGACETIAEARDETKKRHPDGE